MRVGKIVKSWVPVIAWMLLIFAGSTDALSAEHTSRFLVPFLHWLKPDISFQAIAAIHVTLRKLGHFSEYAVLATLLWHALRGTFSLMRLSLLGFAAFIIAAGFAASDEFHQSFVPTRTSSAHDVMIDCLGALTAVTVCVLIARARMARTATVAGAQQL